MGSGRPNLLTRPRISFVTSRGGGLLLNLPVMPQFRKDPFGPAWVIISPERGLEPSDFGSAGGVAATSPLSPGAETRLGKEVRALRPAGSGTNAPDWRVRVLEPYASLLEADKPFQPSGDEPFIAAASSGYQELVVDHPEADMSLDRMTPEHVTELLKLYRERLSLLAGKPGIRHIQLTRSVGRAAGAAYDHPHTQLLAVPVGNRWLDEEKLAAQDHHARHARCLFCDVVAAELTFKARLVSYNEHFIALAPYASKTPFETWLLPRQHSSGFTALASNTVPYLTDLLQNMVRAMNTALDRPPYNLILHTLPLEDDSRYHWHIELLPRLTKHSGFDWSSGFYVNPTPPEDAARFLRGALALQEVNA